MGGRRLSEHPGVIHLNDQTVDVTVDLVPERIRLFAGEQRIGDWAPDDCEIVENGSSGFVIRAENDELPFHPADPAMLRLSLGESVRVDPVPSEAMPDVPLDYFEPTEQPPPRPITLALFYILVAATAVLGVWALSTLF